MNTNLLTKLINHMLESNFIALYNTSYVHFTRYDKICIEENIEEMYMLKYHEILFCFWQIIAQGKTFDFARSLGTRMQSKMSKDIKLVCGGRRDC